jgi:nucleotide-binding universal stress UspA family protein
MILLCYDGSTDARTAIVHAGKLLGGQPATVLTVWEPFMEVLTRFSSGGMTAGMVNAEEIDAANRDGAQSQAEEGAKLARDAGLDAHPRTCSRVTTIADAILKTASELNAGAIVVGSRGLTGVKSLLLGSVSHGLIQHADRTVIVVPSAEVIAARTSHGSTKADAKGQRTPLASWHSSPPTTAGPGEQVKQRPPNFRSFEQPPALVS